MNSLEEQLKEAFSRKEASPDLLRQVMSRIEKEPEKKRYQLSVRFHLLQKPCFALPVASVFTCLLLIAGLMMYREYEKRQLARREEIRAQVILALRIVSYELNCASMNTQGQRCRHRNSIESKRR